MQEIAGFLEPMGFDVLSNLDDGSSAYFLVIEELLWERIHAASLFVLVLQEINSTQGRRLRVRLRVPRC
jgi:hypothetical protein